MSDFVEIFAELLLRTIGFLRGKPYRNVSRKDQTKLDNGSCGPQEPTAESPRNNNSRENSAKANKGRSQQTSPNNDTR